MHCGSFKDGKFLEGRQVSVNKNELVLKLTNHKCLADGSVSEKVVIFSKKEGKRKFFKNVLKTGPIISRLNRVNDA